MLKHRRTSRWLSRWGSLLRPAAFVVVLFGFVAVTQPPAPAQTQDQDAVEEFRQFLRTDLDRLGKLVQMVDDAAKKLDTAKKDTPVNEAKVRYYEQVKTAAEAESDKAATAAQVKYAKLEKRLTTLGQLAAVLRLREWEPRDTVSGIVKIDLKMRDKISDKFAPLVKEVAKDGTHQQKIAMAVMLGEDAAQMRTLKQAGSYYRKQLTALTPEISQMAEANGTNDRGVREAATMALARMDDPTDKRIPAVKHLLEKDGSNLASRRVAYEALGVPFLAVSPRNANAERGVVPYTETDYLSYRTEAKQLLEKQAGEALLLLAKGLKDEDDQVRLLSINISKDIAGLLLDQVQTPPKLTKEAFYYEILEQNLKLINNFNAILEAISNNSDAWISAAGDKDPAVRLMALSVLDDLVTCRNRIRGWQAIFARFAKKPEGEVRIPQPANFQPVALERQGDGPNGVPDALTPGLKKTLSVLEKNLSDPDPAIRLASIQVLDNLGPEAELAMPTLLKALGDKDKFVRWTTIRILGRFAPTEPKKVVPALIPLIAYQDSDMAKALSTTLSRYGAEAAAAVPELAKAIQAGEADYRIAHLQTLAAIGPAGVDALPSIVLLLKNEDPHVRAAAAETLGRFGKLADKSAPELKAALRDEDGDVRRAAGDALLRISGK